MIIAVDHGEFCGPLPGMIDMPNVVDNIDSGVSGILLSAGMIDHCGRSFACKDAPMIIIRLNWSAHFMPYCEYEKGLSVRVASPKQAMASGADIVLACLTLRTGNELIDASNVKTFSTLAHEAKELGMPIIAEYFPANACNLSPEELHRQVYTGSRIAAELGADMIKTFHTYRFEEVVRSCPVPILGLGANKTPTQIQALELAESIVRDGGRGVIFGRNALQVPNPIAFQKALLDVVQGNVPPAEAAEKHNLAD